MILEIDNKGAVDMANNCSVGGRIKHMDVRYLWLRGGAQEAKRTKAVL